MCLPVFYCANTCRHIHVSELRSACHQASGNTYMGVVRLCCPDVNIQVCVCVRARAFTS